jgi:beta-glucosidase
MEVRFPFGHGLSYTRFEYGNIRLSAPRVAFDAPAPGGGGGPADAAAETTAQGAAQGAADVTVDVTVDVTNVGPVAGKEVVQLYVGREPERASAMRPLKELRAFAKVFLEPGESKSVTFTLGKPAFAYHDERIHGLHAPAGVYRVMAGRSSRDIAQVAEVEVAGAAAMPMRVTVNTALADIMRVEGGMELIGSLAGSGLSALEGSESAGGAGAGAGAGGSAAGGEGALGLQMDKMLPNMVPRAFAIFGSLDMTLEQMQELFDAKLNG